MDTSWASDGGVVVREGDDLQEYSPQKILVTGGCGFIGSKFITRLLAAHPDYKIVVVDKLDYCSNLQNLEPYLSNGSIKFVKGDVTNVDMINYLLHSEEIDTVLHFAAETHVDNSFGNSLGFTKSNILGTHVLLEAIRRHTPKVRRLIHVSTDEVYGENKGETFSEQRSTFDPTNPYAATKASAEMLVKAYQQSYNIPIIVCRGNNVYGPQQYPEKVIPKFVHLAMRGQKLCVHGPGNQLRSYLYVDDVADAFSVILHKGTTGQIYNIGTRSEITISEVASDICKAFSLNPTQVEHVEDRLINDQRYFMDASKLESLGWSPKVSWDDGLKATIAWYVEHEDYWSRIDSALKPHNDASSSDTRGWAGYAANEKKGCEIVRTTTESKELSDAVYKMSHPEPKINYFSLLLGCCIGYIVAKTISR